MYGADVDTSLLRYDKNSENIYQEVLKLKKIFYTTKEILIHFAWVGLTYHGDIIWKPLQQISADILGMMKELILSKRIVHLSEK